MYGIGLQYEEESDYQYPLKVQLLMAEMPVDVTSEMMKNGAGEMLHHDDNHDRLNHRCEVVERVISDHDLLYLVVESSGFIQVQW